MTKEPEATTTILRPVVPFSVNKKSSAPMQTKFMFNVLVTWYSTFSLDSLDF